MHSYANASAAHRLNWGTRAALVGGALSMMVPPVSAAVAAPPRADVTVKSISVSASAEPGGSMSLSVAVKNVGRGKASATKTSFSLSKDKAVGGDIKLAQGKPKTLRPGKTGTLKTNVVVPTATPDGAYFVIACADATKKVRELREENNCRASGAPVQVTRPSVPADPSPTRSRLRAPSPS